MLRKEGCAKFGKYCPIGNCTGSDEHFRHDSRNPLRGVQWQRLRPNFVTDQILLSMRISSGCSMHVKVGEIFSLKG